MYRVMVTAAGATPERVLSEIRHSLQILETDKAWYLCVLDECKRIARQYPVGHTEEKKIRAQIKEIERRLASL